MPIQATDPLASFAANPAHWLNNCAEVVPSDTDELPVVASALLVAGAGNVKVTTAGGQVITLTLPIIGVPVRVRKVWATGTTAAKIYAMW